MHLTISRAGNEIGIWTDSEVKIFYKEGQLLPSDYYWTEGMADWKPLVAFVSPAPPPAKPRQNHRALLNLLLLTLLTLLIGTVGFFVGERVQAQNDQIDKDIKAVVDYGRGTDLK